MTPEDEDDGDGSESVIHSGLGSGTTVDGG